MKKKIALIILGICSTVLCAAGLSACNLFGNDGHGDSGKHTHSIVHVKAVAPSCIKEGNKEYWYCNGCGDYFSDEHCAKKVLPSDCKIEKTAHTEVIDQAVPKTCTQDGKTEGKHCSVCNEVTVKQETIPAGHLEVIDRAVEATCTTEGKTQGRHCTFCDTVTVPQVIIPAGHNLIKQQGKDATCTQDGKTDGEYCTKCDYVKEQTVIPAKGHTEVVVEGMEATCTQDGLTEGKRCSDCNTVIVKQSVITRTGHTLVTDEGKKPTCTAPGISDGKHCSVCKEVIIAQTTVPAKGHTQITDPAVEATCESEGKTAGKHCSDCGIVLVAQQTVPKKSHSGAKICNTCGKLMISASTGLTYSEITSLPNGVSASVLRASGGLSAIGVEITGRGSCTDADIVIPETLNGLPVLGIADNAFSSATGGADAVINSLTVPNGVKYIGAVAFFKCTNLRDVTLADSIEYIGDDAFRESGIRSFKCPSGLKQLCSKQFVGCLSLQTVVINAGIEKWNGMDLGIVFMANPSLVEIFVECTEERWNTLTDMGNFWHEDEGWYGDVQVAEHGTRISFYSATRPTVGGAFWHYDANGNPVRW